MLGILYESYIHPLTVLSTLPSAGVGALIALIVFNIEFSLIAFIGIILLIGIVKKNAIMMIDFALVAEREHGLTPREAIRQAALTRFRPIMMTTFAAILGAVPLALGWGGDRSCAARSASPSSAACWSARCSRSDHARGLSLFYCDRCTFVESKSQTKTETEKTDGELPLGQQA